MKANPESGPILFKQNYNKLNVHFMSSLCQNKTFSVLLNGVMCVCMYYAGMTFV